MEKELEGSYSEKPVSYNFEVYLYVPREECELDGKGMLAAVNDTQAIKRDRNDPGALPYKLITAAEFFPRADGSSRWKGYHVEENRIEIMSDSPLSAWDSHYAWVTLPGSEKMEEAIATGAVGVYCEVTEPSEHDGIKWQPVYAHGLERTLLQEA